MDRNAQAPNLIGISGKMGHGKDLVGTIIQALAEGERLAPSEVLEIAQGKLALPPNSSQFVIKKFADKLKDITCMLLGCTREQLEDREFKGSILNEEWTKYGIVRELGTRLVDIVGTEEEAKERLSHWGKKCEIQKVLMTPRLFMQRLGTEAGREVLHPNIWVNALFADYKPMAEKRIDIMDISKEKPEVFKGQPFKVEDYFLGQYPNWIITDVRFPNEAKAVKNHGGILIRINRTNLVNDDSLKNEHPSETSLDNYDDFDYVINNDGSIADLIDKVRKLNIV
jgi:hypothetical protein